MHVERRARSLIYPQMDSMGLAAKKIGSTQIILKLFSVGGVYMNEDKFPHVCGFFEIVLVEVTTK